MIALNNECPNRLALINSALTGLLAGNKLYHTTLDMAAKLAITAADTVIAQLDAEAAHNSNARAKRLVETKGFL